VPRAGSNPVSHPIETRYQSAGWAVASTDREKKVSHMAATESVTEKNKAAKNNDKPAAAAETALPAGYMSAATDAVGFFDADLRADGNDKGIGNGFPIHGVPLHVVITDSSIEKQKPSALVFIRLLEPCKAVRDGNGEGDVLGRPLIETKRGDVVGVWFSAGMRDLADLGGTGVYMYQKDAGNWKKIKGKPSKMKTFKIASDPKKKGEKITVKEDRRNESAGVEARPFTGKKLAGANAAGVDSGDAGDDGIPF
jgi:hypothetical protein